MAQTKRILILGGGFAGVYAALQLEKIFAHNADIQKLWSGLLELRQVLCLLHCPVLATIEVR